jgi:hypothetical protein
MKKLFSFCLVFMLLSSFAYSQNFHFGVKLGMNYSTDILKDFTNSSTGLTSAESKYRANLLGGAFVRVGFSKFMIQPELLLVSNTSNLDFGNNGASAGSFSIKSFNLDVPIMVGFKIIDLEAFHLRLMAGPVATFNLSNSIDLGGATGVSATVKSAQWGYAAGVGADIWKITLDLRYQGQLSNAFEVAGITGVTPSTRQSTIQFTAGFKII